MSVSSPAQPPSLRPGAVVYGPGAAPDALLASFATTLRDRGFRVGGVVQRNVCARDDGCAERMELVDVASGRVINISQNLGSGSAACRVDPAGLAEASVVLRQAMAAGVDLLLVNKFSGQEKLGGGLAQEMLLAMAEGIPVLTAVGGRHLTEWHAFTGGLCDLLPPENDALWRWWGPHRLYRDLALGVADAEVHRVVCGGTWILVESAGGAGLARLPTPIEPPAAGHLAGYARRGLKALADLTVSWDPFDMTVAIAAINAAGNRVEPARGTTFGEPANGLDCFTDGDGRLVVVGAFPDLDRRLPGAEVIEATPGPDEYPAEAAGWLLPGCEAAVITASTLPNRSLPGLLEKARGARVALVGPGTPLSPRLFDHGIEVLAGFVVEDVQGLARAVADGSPPEAFRPFGRRVALRRDSGDDSPPRAG